MAEVLGDTTCVIHPERQSVARCPQCRKFYCSECITEHEGKLTCASCLREDRDEVLEVSARRRAIRVMPVMQLGIAIFVCWFLFYLIAGTLGDMPDEFHDGTIWE